MNKQINFTQTLPISKTSNISPVKNTEEQLFTIREAANNSFASLLDKFRLQQSNTTIGQKHATKVPGDETKVYFKSLEMAESFRLN